MLPSLSRLVSPMWMGQDVRRQRQAEPQPEQETELGPSQVGLKLTLLSNYIKMIGNVGHICVARVAAEPRCDCGQARVQQESRTNNRRQRSAGGGRRTNAGLVCRSAASRQQGAGGRRHAAGGMRHVVLPCAGCKLPVARCRLWQTGALSDPTTTLCGCGFRQQQKQHQHQQRCR